MQNRPFDPDDDKKPLFPLEEMDMLATSDMDMTGLIPAGPQNRGELESYQEIYPYLAPPIDPEQV